jgi:hypothetical protein
LRYLPQHERNSLNDLEIHVNESIFNTNGKLYSLLSDSFFKLNSLSTEITLPLQNEEMSCFVSFLSILEGFSMNLLKFESNLLLSFFQKVECPKTLSFLLAKIKIPETVEESIQFLQYSFSNILDEHFQKSISILA